MNVAYIMTGNWFPRTKLHLREYFRFMRDGSTHLPIDADLLLKSREQLDIERLAYVGLAIEGRFDHVDARCNGIETSYYEDGLLTARIDAGKDVDADSYRLHSFYNEKLLSAVGILFSVGLPAIGVHDPKYTERPSVVVATHATAKEVEAWAKSLNDTIHFTAKHKGHQVFYGDRLIVVVTRAPESDVTHQLVRTIIFFREYESRLSNFLNMHREVWQSIDQIRKKKSLSLSELPAIRDHLLDADRDMSIVIARLSQMGYFLVERQTEIDELDRTDYFRALEAYRFGKMLLTTKYLQELWAQLNEYIESTADIIALMYQENFEKSLNALQFIFLVSSIAGVMLLGNMTTGTFAMSDLVLYGGASLAATLLIYFGLKFFTSSLQRIETKTLLGENRPFARDRRNNHKLHTSA